MAGIILRPYLGHPFSSTARPQLFARYNLEAVACRGGERAVQCEGLPVQQQHRECAAKLSRRQVGPG